MARARDGEGMGSRSDEGARLGEGEGARPRAGESLGATIGARALTGMDAERRMRDAGLLDGMPAARCACWSRGVRAGEAWRCVGRRAAVPHQGGRGW